MVDFTKQIKMFMYTLPFNHNKRADEENIRYLY